jgi:hypothetical protein
MRVLTAVAFILFGLSVARAFSAVFDATPGRV